MKNVTNKKFDNIFTAILIIGFLIFAFYIGGSNGVINAIIVFIQESIKIFICIIIFVILCVLFPKIRKFFDKTKND